jgi:hypothetical protein
MVECYGKDPLASPSVMHWRQEFHGGREGVENSPRTGRPLGLGIRLRIERALEVFLNGSARMIAASAGDEFSKVFEILPQVLHLKFRHWRWVPSWLSGAQKIARVEGATLLRAEFLTAKQRY